MIRDLIIKNRSYRRFDESVKISEESLLSWIELARFSASGRNSQPLKYIICTSKEVVSQLFPHIGWAGYLPNWNGPEPGERPVAYIVVLHDKNISDGYFCDDGIAIQSILLGAADDGFGGCIIGSVNKSKAGKILDLDDNLEILWLIALGKPAEKVVIDDLKNRDIKYWRDEKDIHHVPKRPLSELVVKNL